MLSIHDSQQFCNLNIIYFNKECNNSQCERAEKDKEDLTLKVENLIKHISEMERQLQRNKSNLENMKLPEESETITSLIQEVADLKGNINNKVAKSCLFLIFLVYIFYWFILISSHDRELVFNINPLCYLLY